MHPTMLHSTAPSTLPLTHSLTALLGLWGSDPQNLTVNFRGGLLRIRVKEEESKVSERVSV
jgi:hypothetical protein